MSGDLTFGNNLPQLMLVSRVINAINILKVVL